jgi:RHS repeat-associated protein
MSDSMMCFLASHFTGKERDAESGLDYFGARYYGSSMGRFMSPDPILSLAKITSGGKTDMLNKLRFSLCGNCRLEMDRSVPGEDYRNGAGADASSQRAHCFPGFSSTLLNDVRCESSRSEIIAMMQAAKPWH